jgi:hypothetical protein
MAVSGSVRSVKGGLVDRDGTTIAVLISSLEGMLDRSVDEALSALGVACQLAGRSARAPGRAPGVRPRVVEGSMKELILSWRWACLQ